MSKQPMSIQLTPEQMSEIKRLVKLAGGSVIFPKPKVQSTTRCKPDHLEAQIARLRGMVFKTANVKSTMIKNLTNSIRCRDWHLAHPVDLTDALGMFGVRLRDVRPWGNNRGECLANGLPNGRRALTYQPCELYNGNSVTWAEAAAPVKRIVCL